MLIVDLEKAYDSIPLRKLWKALEEKGISSTLIKTVKELYRRSVSYINPLNTELNPICHLLVLLGAHRIFHVSRIRVKQEGLLSEGFEVTNGLRQGCCLSPTLFKIYVEKALNTWRKKWIMQQYIRYNLQTTRCVMAQNKEDLEYMGRKLQEEYSKWGFTMNIAGTKYMSVGTDTNHLQMDNGDIITGCTEFRYLGTIFTKDGTD